MKTIKKKKDPTKPMFGKKPEPIKAFMTRRNTKKKV
jgi:hypothetical protein